MKTTHSLSSFLFLTGFMGVGKSFFGERVGDRLQIPALDLDREIEKQENCSIADIFAGKGEAYFRNLEEGLLKSLIQNYTPPIVVSLGGGTLMNNTLPSLVKYHGFLVCLQRGFLVCLQRNSIRPALTFHEDRPLLGSKSVRILFQERRAGYSAAHTCIRVDMLTQDEVLGLLINQWKFHEKAG
jgi:shikimate kinase